MRRILLVIEDFNELIYVQTVLKKVGFDIEGVSQARKFEELLLGFNPQSIIMTAKGAKINGLQISSKIKRSNGMPYVILLKNSTTQIAEDELKGSGVDLIVDTPVNVSKLLIGLSSLHGLEEAALLAKLSKLQSGPQSDISKSRSLNPSTDRKEDVISVKGDSIQDELVEVKGPGHSDSFFTDSGEEEAQNAESLVSAEAKAERRKRYESYLEKLEGNEGSHFSRERILEFNKWIRSQSQDEDIGPIEDERKEFVRKLFRKKT